MHHNLELEVQKTTAGVYTVTFGYKEAPLDVQEAAFAAHGQEIVSPAQLGFLRATQPEGISTFNLYSRTSADVFYDDRSDKVVLVPDGTLSRLMGITSVVTAHRQGWDYVLLENQLQREVVYGMIDEMLQRGTAVTADHGQIDVPSSRLGQTEVTSGLFSDSRLGIKAQEYGDWLNDQGVKTQSFLFDSNDYAHAQPGPYVNRLRVCGPDRNFIGDGSFRYLHGNEGAFGVRFEKNAEALRGQRHERTK